MAPVILVEGPDGAGKSTLAHWLEKERGYRYFHEGPPPLGINLLEYYSTKLWNYLQMKQPVVADRFHIGEVVYGSIARHEDRMGYYGMKLFIRILNAQPVSCYICLPSLKTAITNWKIKHEANDDYLSRFDRFRDCYFRYKGLLSYLPHHYFDYEQRSFESIVAPPSTFPDGAIGSPTAKYLIVGEQVSVATRRVDLPFFGDTGCSRLLNDSLWAAGFKEEEMMFTNAYDLRGKPRNLLGIVKRLPNLQAIIALGKKAHRHCVDDIASGNIIGVNHPQFAKRFGRKMKKSYVDQLKEVREACQKSLTAT